jgi:hypothetical protein
LPRRWPRTAALRCPSRPRCGRRRAVVWRRPWLSRPPRCRKPAAEKLGGPSGRVTSCSVRGVWCRGCGVRREALLPSRGGLWLWCAWRVRTVPWRHGRVPHVARAPQAGHGHGSSEDGGAGGRRGELVPASQLRWGGRGLCTAGVCCCLRSHLTARTQPRHTCARPPRPPLLHPAWRQRPRAGAAQAGRRAGAQDQAGAAGGRPAGRAPAAQPLAAWAATPRRARLAVLSDTASLGCLSSKSSGASVLRFVTAVRTLPPWPGGGAAPQAGRGGGAAGQAGGRAAASAHRRAARHVALPLAVIAAAAPSHTHLPALALEPPPASPAGRYACQGGRDGGPRASSPCARLTEWAVWRGRSSRHEHLPHEERPVGAGRGSGAGRGGGSLFGGSQTGDEAEGTWGHALLVSTRRFLASAFVRAAARGAKPRAGLAPQVAAAAVPAARGSWNDWRSAAPGSRWTTASCGGRCAGDTETELLLLLGYCSSDMARVIGLPRKRSYRHVRMQPGQAMLFGSRP